jgi:multidrug efflux pump subunit AcrB
MKDLPGGTVRTGVGNINVRTMGVAERSVAVREIVVAATPDGQVVRVGDIAAVRHDYIDEQIMTRFRAGDDSGSSVSLTVYKVGEQDAVSIAQMVRAYVAGRQQAMGVEGVEFDARWDDRLFATLCRRTRRSPRAPIWPVSSRAAWTCWSATPGPARCS